MSNTELMSPAYLTRDMAEAAVEAVVEAILDPAADSKLANAANFVRPKRNQCHVVVVVPAHQGLSTMMGGLTGWRNERQSHSFCSTRVFSAGGIHLMRHSGPLPG